MNMQVGHVSRPCRASPAIQRPEILGHRPLMGLRRRDRINDSDYPGNYSMGILADCEHSSFAQAPAL